jgi:hypothetical protein
MILARGLGWVLQHQEAAECLSGHSRNGTLMQSNEVDMRVFARDYLEEMKDTSRDGIEFWQQLHDWIDQDPEKAWLALVELSKIASIHEIGRLGAGPLEELLVTHDIFAPRAAEVARTNKTFRSMLSRVTPRGMSAEMERVVRAAIE